MDILKEFKAEKLSVAIYKDEATMGKYAADDAIKAIKDLLLNQKEINIIFAAAVSQVEFLNNLIEDESIVWSKINAFHMDEYFGSATEDQRSLASFLKSRFFNQINLKNEFFINGSNPDYNAECERYTKLLKEHPCDIVFMGIGDNGHLAFNDPHVADFKDPKAIKMVDIDKISKQQQVNAKNFANVDEVPSMAYTLTIPTLLNCKQIFCMVPTTYKAKATYDTINGPRIEACPASILRTCSYAKLYLDADSASLLG